MGAVRRYLRRLSFAVIGIPAVVIILGGSAVGLFALAEQFRDETLVAGLSMMVGRLRRAAPRWGDVAAAHIQFLHPLGADLPEREDIDVLFREAWQAVKARDEEIEAEAMA